MGTESGYFCFDLHPVCPHYPLPIVPSACFVWSTFLCSYLPIAVACSIIFTCGRKSVIHYSIFEYIMCILVACLYCKCPDTCQTVPGSIIKNTIKVVLSFYFLEPICNHQNRIIPGAKKSQKMFLCDTATI